LFKTTCHYHPSFQQIAMVDLDAGEYVELRLLHARGEAQGFYESLSGPVRVGVESSGNLLWFERVLQKLGHELWLGDAGVIRAKAPRKQKTDVRDASHLLQLSRENNFPRISVPSVAERDLRQLLKHRHTLV
jgi:transposase